jgi:K+-transporting ATPase KdpF subunit
MRPILIFFLAGCVEIPSNLFRTEMNSSAWYIIAGIIALLILGYLLITLLKPEKF